MPDDARKIKSTDVKPPYIVNPVDPEQSLLFNVACIDYYFNCIYIVSTIHRASELAEKTIDFMIIDKKLAIVKKKMIEKEKEKINEKT